MSDEEPQSKEKGKEKRHGFSFLKPRSKSEISKRGSHTKNVRRSDVRLVMTAVVFMILSLIMKGYWDSDELDRSYKKFRSDIIKYQWFQIESVFEGKYRQAFDQSTIFSERIAHDVLSYYNTKSIHNKTTDEKAITNEISYALNNIDVDDHPIINIISNVLSEQFFDGIINDSNDPFVVILGEEPLIVADTSLNCSAVGRTRTFDEEFPMHANIELAENAFHRISLMDTPDWENNIFDEPIFFQFEDHTKGNLTKPDYPEDSIYYEFNGSRAYELEYYDIAGLKEAFLSSEGNWKEVFSAFEFIAPTYIYDFKDLSGVLRVNNRGIRQDSKIIAVNVVFNFKDVLNNMPREREKLLTFSKDLEKIDLWYIKESRFILAISFLALLLAGMVLITTVKLTAEE